MHIFIYVYLSSCVHWNGFALELLLKLYFLYASVVVSRPTNIRIYMYIDTYISTYFNKHMYIGRYIWQDNSSRLTGSVHSHAFHFVCRYLYTHMYIAILQLAGIYTFKHTYLHTYICMYIRKCSTRLWGYERVTSCIIYQWHAVDSWLGISELLLPFYY